MQFANNLTDTRADLSQKEFLIISIKRNWHYVQFAGQGNFGMRAEAISNAYALGDNKLSDEACAELLSLGWKAPTYLPDRFHTERNEPDGSPNYFLDLIVPAPYAPCAAREPQKNG